MNILFLCGSLEPGRDGVGDYTRRLAGALQQYGHTTAAIALNDMYIDTIEESYQRDETVTIPVLRLPARLPIAVRVQAAQSFFKIFNAQWVSLQYVLYAFHPKGVPFAWIRQFRRCAPTGKWHVMMHELWIGSKKKDTVKDKLVGGLQQLIIRLTLKSIKPSGVTSNLSYYQLLLKKIGYRASILPVFNNIGLGQPHNKKLYNKLLSVIPNLSDFCIGVLFGGMYANAEIYKNAALLIQKAATENQQILFVHIGRSGIISSFFTTLKSRYQCECFSFGEQSSTDIASFFCHAHFGVSTYSKEFLGKSGSVAAMLNNKLPVILLKSMDIYDNTQYSYAKHIGDISSLTTFCNQSKDWSSLYGLEHAALFYHQFFTQY